MSPLKMWQNSNIRDRNSNTRNCGCHLIWKDTCLFWLISTLASFGV